MPAELSQLVSLRSQLANEVIRCLTDLAKRAAELPPDYPPHLLGGAPGTTAFDDLRQALHVVRAGQDSSPAVPWDHKAGERFPHAVILGDPGSGKTWLLRYEARRLARTAAEGLARQKIGLDEATFPIYLRLPDLDRTRGDLADAIPKLAADGRSRRFARFVRERLAADQCVVLLDGWDEVAPPRDVVGHRLDGFARNRSKTRALLTSRVAVCGSSGRFLPDAQVLKLHGLDRSQVVRFIDKWTEGRADDLADLTEVLDLHEDLLEVVCIARLLVALCQIGRARRVKIYREFLKSLIQARPGLYDGTQKRLGELAWRHLVGDKGARFGESFLREVVSDELDELKSAGLQEDGGRLVADLLRTGVLTTVDESSSDLSFLHPALRDYLAAQHLAEELCASNRDPQVVRLPQGEVSAEQFLQEKAEDPAWRETLVFLAGCLPRDWALAMVARLAGCHRPDASQPGTVSLYRLVLAARCAGELEA